jgi:hypothetical protein
MLDIDENDRDVILYWFHSFQKQGDEALARFIVHCGIDIDAAEELDDAIVAHYRLPDGSFDIDRAADDLATWPPVAARIKELEAENGVGETDG